jgi:3-deoxy-manno-octulosonate cytidylyltransferase (CMP-KDO synthetase)
MKIIGVIPARYASTRFPGKPLALINGVPLIGHVVKGAKKCKKLSRIIVATDHKDIAKVAKQYGAEVKMTASSLPSGSDRVWAVAKDINCDVVLNIQGDEPLINAEPLNLLCNAFKNKSVQMATLGRGIQSLEELNNISIAKIIVDKDLKAMLFTRLPVPFTRERWKPGIGELQPSKLKAGKLSNGIRHIGLYAYRKDALKRFCAQKPIELELAEGLEQLRALWMGIDIQVILTKFESWGVDHPEDVLQIERILAKK